MGSHPKSSVNTVRVRQEVVHFIVKQGVILDLTVCVAIRFLLRHALLVTAGCEAWRTMNPDPWGWRRNRERLSTLGAPIR